MFILYAVPIGLVLGLLLGGRPAGLATLQFRFGWVMVVGLLVQVVLFSTAVSNAVGELGPPIYVLSTAVVIVSVLLNLRITGMALVALGAISNLVAIVLNGGYMPADAGAMAALGKTAPTTYSNSAILAEPVLKPLTDIFALPTWVPFANVFSVGDVLISVGVVVVIVAAMRRPVAELTTTWYV
jgi:uncharacterized protein DUF5317